jgi:hypothetical protein
MELTQLNLRKIQLIASAILLLSFTGCGKQSREYTDSREVEKTNYQFSESIHGEHHDDDELLDHQSSDSLNLLGRAKTYSYSIQSGGHMAEISHAETVLRFNAGLKELEAVSGVKFVRTTGRANIRISFRRQSQMLYGALGLAYRNGTILINNSRKIGLANPNSRNAQAVVMHEVMHY